MAEKSFADLMREKAAAAQAGAKALGAGGRNYVKLVKGEKKLRILLDLENTLTYLKFRSHSGKNEEDKFQQSVDLSWLRRKPTILQGLIERQVISADDAAEIVALGDPATNLFFLLKNGMGMTYEQIRKIGRDSPGGSPRALWNVWSEEDGLGILETAAGDKGNLVTWFDTASEKRGAFDLLGHAGYVLVTGTGDGLSRSYNFAFYEDPMEFDASTRPYDLITQLGSKVLKPYEKLEFVKRSYSAHLLEAGVSNLETLFDGPTGDPDPEADGE